MSEKSKQAYYKFKRKQGKKNKVKKAPLTPAQKKAWANILKHKYELSKKFKDWKETESIRHNIRYWKDRNVSFLFTFTIDYEGNLVVGTKDAWNAKQVFGFKELGADPNLDRSLFDTVIFDDTGKPSEVYNSFPIAALHILAQDKKHIKIYLDTPMSEEKIRSTGLFYMSRLSRNRSFKMLIYPGRFGINRIVFYIYTNTNFSDPNDDPYLSQVQDGDSIIRQSV